MIYVIIGAVAAFVLLLLFWDDHDSSYDRGDGRSRYSRKAKEKSLQSKRTNVVESIIKEVKEQNADSLKAMQQDVRKAFDEARTAFNDAMKGTGQRSYWAGSVEDVDEQEPLEQEEPLKEGERYEDEEKKKDLSFLDTLEYYEHLQENTETFDIAGLTYHCTVLDRGPIVGYVKPDSTNPHDPRAQAVCRYDGKLLGYIPRTQQDWYEDFNEDNVVCPFVGEITVDRRGWMTGEIKVIQPVNKEFVQEEIEDGL